MLSESILLALYGGVLIASFFMACSVGRLAWDEAVGAKWADLRHNTFFIITAALVFQAVALIIISGIRVYDGLTGFHIGGRWPWSLTIAMGMLFAAKAGFHWAATLRLSRWPWRLFLLATILWLVLLVLLDGIVPAGTPPK